jgi:transcriptional regulator with XRE-family HTH domain
MKWGRDRRNWLPYLTPIETSLWLQERLALTGIGSISNLAVITGINKGTLSKYFSHRQRPSIDVLMVLCRGLQVTPAEMLIALGALDSANA